MPQRRVVQGFARKALRFNVSAMATWAAAAVLLVVAFAMRLEWLAWLAWGMSILGLYFRVEANIAATCALGESSKLDREHLTAVMRKVLVDDEN